MKGIWLGEEEAGAWLDRKRRGCVGGRGSYEYNTSVIRDYLGYVLRAGGQSIIWNIMGRMSPI